MLSVTSSRVKPNWSPPLNLVVAENETSSLGWQALVKAIVQNNTLTYLGLNW